VIQGGAILAVLGLYWSRVRQMLAGLTGRDEIGFRLLRNIVIAFMPAAILGPLLNDLIETHLFAALPVLIALGLGGVVMIVLSPWQRTFFHGEGHDDPENMHSFVDLEHLTWQRALLIGLLQCVAMWPGTSRSMMTIVGGMLTGLRPRQAAEFSFLLGLPTLGGACVYSLAGDLLGDEASMFETLGALPLVVGITVATISAALAIKWLVGYLSRHGVAVFGWYRLALCAVLGALWWTGVVSFGP
jgi:undecaprenyl-diphosphatase